LARALSQHSALWASNESKFLDSLLGQDHAERVYASERERPTVSWLVTNGVSRSEFLSHLGLGINALFTGRSGNRRWIDHTPHYTLIADLLGELFPGALFLHLLRDGRRVVHSMMHFAQMFEEPRRSIVAPTLPSYTRDFGEACRTWRRMVEAGSAFTSLHPKRSLTVRNELLTSDPEIGFAAILEFLGVPSEPAPAEWSSANRVNSSFRLSAAPEGTELTAPNPWHGWPREWRQTFREEAGAILVELGMARREELS